MPACTTEDSFSTYRNSLKAAGKRHRSFAAELEKVLETIRRDANSVGDRIPNIPEYHVRKVRIGVPAERIPPRSGYRLIFEVIDSGAELRARLLAVYYKGEQENLHSAEVIKLVRQATAQVELFTEAPADNT